MEKHVTSLELSKRLKELGFPQESEFRWYSPNKQPFRLTSQRDLGHFWENNEFYSAYLVSELGEYLPDQVDNQGEDKEIFKFITVNWPYKCPINKWKTYLNKINGQTIQTIHTSFQRADLEVNARALMLIHLKENNLI